MSHKSFLSTQWHLSVSFDTGDWLTIIEICIFWDNKHLWAIILASLEKPFHVVCQSAPVLLSARMALQTNMEKHHPISDLHNEVYGKKNTKCWKKEFDFPTETGIKYQPGRGVFLFDWSCYQARAEFSQLKYTRLVQREPRCCEFTRHVVVKPSRWTGGGSWINVPSVEFLPL